jgi:hypothetical protein
MIYEVCFDNLHLLVDGIIGLRTFRNRITVDKGNVQQSSCSTICSTAYIVLRSSCKVDFYSYIVKFTELPSSKCIGYSDESQNSLQATSFLYIKQYSNQSGLMEYISGVRLPLSTEILDRFQWKALRMIVDAPRYVPNTVIRMDLQIPTVKEEIRRYSSQYSARLSAHPNDLTVNLVELPDNRRLRTHLPNDLPTTILV